MLRSLAPILLLLASTAGAASSAFLEQCEKMAAEANIAVSFEEKVVARDTNRSIDELKGLSRAGKTQLQNPYHSVLGLTQAEPTAKLDIKTRALTDSDGSVCASPSLNLKLGFSVLAVHLARELKNPCRQNIVAEHEEEHVRVWREHLRAGARMMVPVLKRDLIQTPIFSSRKDAETDARQRAEQRVADLLGKLKEGIVASHQQIDSPGSYQFVENRLRTCP